MQILQKRLTKSEFTDYVFGKDFGTIPPTEMVLHHTWRPTVQQWSGLKSIQGLKSYYEGLGWPAGPHIFVAEDGIWLFTDMDSIGIHAGTGNATWTKDGKTYRGYRAGVSGATLTGYSIGIEVVGDYDEHVWEGATLDNALHVLSTLKKRFGWTNEEIRFHREFSPKSCPGNAITRSWLRKKLSEFEFGVPPQNGYEFKYSKETALRAKDLGLLQQVDTETREIIAIGLVRLYDKLKSEMS